MADGGGWMVVQRRVDAAVNFSRNLKEYKDGFGDLHGNFWLGLELIHKLAAPGKKAIVRLDFRTINNMERLKSAIYNQFSVNDESDGYRLLVDGYDSERSTAKTGFLSVDMGRFVTYEEDHEASMMGGGWWKEGMRSSNINGDYYTVAKEIFKEITWDPFFNSIGFAEMKIRYAMD